MSDEIAGLDPDEPHTPAWFTFLGLGVFLAGGIFFLIRSSAGEVVPGTPPEANSVVAAPNNDAPQADAPHE